MSGSGPEWTRQQRLAIETLDRNVLVTASAGTGKTTVLSKRVVEILCDRSDPTDVSQILVLTFTEASAEEMKMRIAEELSEAFRKSAGSYLRHQMLLLDAGDISTIDSFCKRTITNNFHILGIDPTFRIIDADEQKLLKSEILENVIEEAWQDETLAAALVMLLNNRSLHLSAMGFLGNIYRANGFLGSVVSPGAWHEKAVELSGIDDVGKSELGEKQKQIIFEKLHQCRSMLEHAIMLDERFTEDCHWSGHITAEYLNFVEECIDLVEAGDDRYVERISGFSPGRYKAKPKGFDDDIKDMIKTPVAKVKKIINELGELAIVNPDYEKLILRAANMQTKTLLELIKRFNKRYSEVKREMNCLDFADLEHSMLRLLNESPATAEALRNRFKYIFVDEFQDTNYLQQAILEKLCRRDNLFVVGDIKQSIYAFRQAKPEIFLQLLKGSTDDETDSGKPLRVDLSDNFRSRREVLDFANLVFERIMTESVAAVDYDSKAALKAGFEYQPAQGACVEVDFINEESRQADEGITPAQRQAAYIAEKIKGIVNPAGESDAIKIYDKQTDSYRPPDFGDIVILMRSPSTVINEYLEILRLAGIPVVSNSSSGYFQATEISDMISLMKLLDNPQRDIDLAAVMRSPLFGFSDTELALIRDFGKTEGRKKAGFYDCVLKYHAQGEDAEIRGRIAGLLERLNEWRTFACRGSLADLIWLIYRQTGYLSFVSALADGRQRKANLLKLHDRAIQFEGFSTNGQAASLTRFVSFIEKLDEEDQDWAPASADSSQDNAVRIMSVHNSKGLEFPIIFLAEVNRKFNRRDVVAECLIDDENTVGLKVIDPESKEKSSSIAHQVIAAEKLKTLHAEEMRILYVAVTRARERLFITGSAGKKCASIAADCAVCGSDGLKGWQLKSADSQLDWLVMAMGNQKKIQRAFGLDPRGPEDSDLFEVNMVGADELNSAIKQLRRKEKSTGQTVAVDPQRTAELAAKVRASINWTYPHIHSANTPAKMSVSELTHRDDEFAGIDLSGALERVPAALTGADTEPGGKTKVDPRLRGTATHLILEKLDLDKPVGLEAVKSLTESLIAEGLIDAEVAATINYDSIVKFFQSDTGKLATSAGSKVMREWPFIYGLSAGEVDGSSDGDIVVVQGIVDMLIDSGDGVYVVDFKTDNVDEKQVSERAKVYRQQISLYARAVEEITGKKAAAKCLYFLNCGVEVRY